VAGRAIAELSGRAIAELSGRAIAELAGRQHGVISVPQLRALGLDGSAVDRRVRTGLLHRVYRGVYSVGVARVSVRGRYLGAVMACGAGTRLSYRAAADLWDLRPNATFVEVTVPQKRHGPPGVQVHRTRMLDPQDFAVKEGIPVTSVARTLLDLSAVVRPEELTAAIDRAERLRIFDLRAVTEVLDRANGRRGAGALRRAIAAYEPSTQKSKLERRFKQLLRSAPDIPSPFFNAAVEGEQATHEVDAFWPTNRLAIQLDGFEFHRTRRDRERDATSDADLELAGQRVMRLTWDDVTVHDERTLRRLRLAGGWRVAPSA
jgi:predicted transcriptional regulator of viral defense system